MNALFEAKIVKSIECYSLKYIDIIEGDSLAAQIARINAHVRVGDHSLQAEPFNLRVELERDGFLHVIQLGGPGLVQLPTGQRREGLLVDIDTLKTHAAGDTDGFLAELDATRLGDIHLSNKRMFFSCLTPETIEYLEPEYD